MTDMPEPVRQIVHEATTRAAEFFAATEEQLITEAVAKIAELCGWHGDIDIARHGRSYLVTATDTDGNRTTTTFGHQADPAQN